MSWPTSFVGALSARTVELVFGVRRLVIVGGGFDSQWVAATHRRTGLGLVWPAELGRRIVDGQGGALGVRTWNAGAGSWSFEIVGEAAIKRHLAAIRLGSYLELLAGPKGSGPSDWQPVAWGQVVSRRRGSAPVMTVTCAGPLAALRSRPALDSADALLFKRAGTQTSITERDYKPGDSYIGVTVADDFHTDSDTGLGLALIAPSGSGDPFFVSYTGTGPGLLPGEGRLTGVTGGLLGTTAANAAIGSEVTRLAYLRGHPLTSVLKLLISGSGGGSSYDTLPDSWGLTLPERLIDVADIERVRDDQVQLSGGGTYRWDIWQDAAVSSGYSFLSGLLAGAGLTLTPRQGKLTARAVRDPSALGLALLGDPLTDARIEPGSVSVTFEHPDARGAQRVQVISGDQEGDIDAFTLTALPRLPMAQLTLPSVLYTNASDHIEEILDRIGGWYQRTPVMVSATWAGLAEARRARGDIVPFTASRIAALHDRTGAAFTGAPALILDRVIDWRAGRVTMTLALLPAPT